MDGSMNGLVHDQDEWVRYLNNPWESVCPVESPTTRDYSSGEKSADREMFKRRGIMRSQKCTTYKSSGNGKNHVDWRGRSAAFIYNYLYLLGSILYLFTLYPKTRSVVLRAIAAFLILPRLLLSASTSNSLSNLSTASSKV